jgi:hypothetical protein
VVVTQVNFQIIHLEVVMLPLKLEVEVVDVDAKEE